MKPKAPPDDWQEQDDHSRMRARMDFTMEDVRTDEATRMVYFRIVPDPRRYDRVEIEGQPYFADKYLDCVISEKVMRDACAAQMAGMPIHYLPSSIKSAPDYAKRRQAALKSELADGNYVAPTEEAARHRAIAEHKGSTFLVFLSVDICGSSALRRTDPASFDRVYDIFLRELGTVVGQFKGTILKTTGDGFIAYIDYPAWTQQCDKAVDMGLTFLVVLAESINPALLEAGLPQLKIRVGADCGEAWIRNLAVPATGYFSPEVASDALNQAVKLEQSAAENEMRIGRNLYELLHVQWLERAEDVPFDGSDIGMPGYKTYRMT